MPIYTFARFVAAALLFTIATATAADAPQAHPKQSDAAVTAADQRIARFLDDQVIAVVRVDIESFDLKAIGDWSRRSRAN